MNHDATKAPHEPEVTIHHFADDGSIPNNPTLPLLIYEDVLDLAGSDAAATCIERFAAMAGMAPGETASFRSRTTTAPPTKCWASARVKPRCARRRARPGDDGQVRRCSGAARRHRASKSGLKPRSSRRRRLSRRHGLGSLSWRIGCARGRTPQHPGRTASG